MMEWANFYNGVAHGLGMPGLERSLREQSRQVLPPQTQAGLLLASGLTGHIKSISLYDIHELLTKNDRFLVVSLLIGCSVAHKGTSDVHVSLIGTREEERRSKRAIT